MPSFLILSMLCEYIEKNLLCVVYKGINTVLVGVLKGTLREFSRKCQHDIKCNPRSPVIKLSIHMK